MSLRLQLPLILVFTCLTYGEAPKPNILVILADDMGYSDAGCYGGEIETPNLDQLAANGLRFTQGYSTGRCWPSRAALLTGYYAKQVNMDPVKQPMPRHGGLIPRYLKPEGYRSYHSGKWHIRNLESTNKVGGFDESWSLDKQDGYFRAVKHRINEVPQPAQESDGEFYMTTHTTDHAIQCLKDHQKNHADKPFFSYVAYIAPHFPLMAPQEDIAKYDGKYDAGWDKVRNQRHKRQISMNLLDCKLTPPLPKSVIKAGISDEELKKQIEPGEIGHHKPWSELTEEQQKFQADKMEIHAAMVDNMDQNIGRLTTQLKKMGAFDNTLIIFVSDNGTSAEILNRAHIHEPGCELGGPESYLCLGPGWSTTGNTPFRRHKMWMDEGGISSPFIVHWPKGITDKGTLRRTPVHFIDLLPTFLELSGASDKPDWKKFRNSPELPGKSLTPLFKKDQPFDREYLYWEHLGSRALRIGNWKILASTRKSDWKLYNLAEDRSELYDLAKKEPERLKAMADKWQQLTEQFKKEASRELVD